ncbi:ricin-type beta-trefoil lectin domain protein [Micromonospora phytophila]|uniref:ricin-type beta-trefoil lectin domain protein n=1 Tax=Micromonospora phytophila TaxID=709888 RepID=UPI00202DC2FF|nr:ricin-type beta-trefoil lectin domain protein [Micromonospora phytophila]MCM0674805.1 ricin-type beta-trefoil lectin domain protein [Micromonospora phytophila]
MQVRDQAAAQAAGVSGALLTLSRADGVSQPGRARIRIDYSQFANAFGGDYAGRLRLVELPACAVSTPAKGSCRVGKDLGSVNAAGTLSADVTLTQAGTTTIALTPSASSAGGTFEATSLRQAYSWSAGSIGGSFAYSYPIAVPPAPGPAPNLALSYDSGLVDGQTLAQNGQVSWIGEGWDLQVGYIERSYRPCSQDGAGSTLRGDLCWFSPDNATLVFAGQSAPLVRDGTNGWRSAKDDGLKIEKRNDTDNDDGDNEYWKVTAQDGTQYFFGVEKRYANDNQRTNSVQTVAVYGDDASDPCANTMCREAYRWNLDYVIDPRGNSMTYVYKPFEGRYQPGTATLGSTFLYDLAANLDFIDYGDRAGSEHSGNAPMRVLFGHANRCVGSCADADYVDTPLDLYCTPEQTSCTERSPAFFNRYRLASITTEVLDSSSGQYRKVDRWDLTHTYPPNPDVIAPAGAPDTSPNLWLQSIRHTGYGRDATTLAEPSMEFGGDFTDPAGGEPWGNRVDWGADAGVPPYVHYRLTSVRTGTGAETRVTYTRTPEGGVECHRSWAPIPDNNPQLCFPQHHKPNDEQQPAGYGWFYKYLVAVVTERDLTGGSPDEWTFYKYTNESSSDSALWAHDSNETVQLAYRTWSQWRGYGTVTATKEASENVETVSRNVFHRGMDGDDKNKADGTGPEWFSRRTGLLAPIGTPGLDGSVSGQGGKCLDIVNASKVAGTSVHLWNCYGNWSQVWHWDSESGAVKNPETGMCLDIDNWGTANGSEVQIWTCTGDTNQVWQPRPDGGLWNPQSKRCLDISSWGTANGARVQLWDCTGDWNQVWQPQNNQNLVNPQANRCIDIANSGTTDGTKVWPRKCSGQANQVWQLQGNGSLKNPTSGRCLDISGPNTASGTLVHLWSCYTGWSQVWEQQADGSLKNPHSGRCLEAATGTTGDASGQLKIADCNGSISQKWTNRFLDADGLHGSLRESLDLDGTKINSSTVHVPTVTRTGTRAAPVTDGKEMRAHRVSETTTKARTWIAADSKWRWTEGQASYDTKYGLPTDTRDLGDVSVAADDTCVRTEYARNEAAYLVGYPSQVTEYAGACGTGTVLSVSQTFYDSTTTLHAAPTRGLKTKNQTLNSTDVWAVTEATYDQRGRPLANKDARGQTSTTVYTPSDNLPLKEAKVINPLGHTSTVSFDEGRGVPTQAVDANNRTTTTEYDQLGRRTAVYLPTEKKVNGDPPSMKYSYDIRGDLPSKLTTEALQDRAIEPGTSPTYLTSYEFLDGRLRTRNTQAAAPGGGRIITETKYDGRGQVAVQTAPFHNAAIAGSALVTAAAANVPSQTVYSYDNLNRLTAAALQANGTEKWRTTHSYDGNRHTVNPPSGGDTTTMYDAAGRPVRLTVHPTTSTSETTVYGYDTAGNLATVTDPTEKNVTRYSYNLAGLRTKVEDPNTGTTLSAYNAAGDLKSTTDARGQKITLTYDALGRLASRWSGEFNTGTKLATYEYDSLTAAKGQLSRTTRHVGTADYVVEPMGYDDRYRPTGTRWIIPNAEGTLAGSYETEYGYDAANHLTSITYDARAGLPAETVGTSYDSLGYVTRLAGINSYVTATSYTGVGQLAARTYGTPGAGELIRNYSWEPATGRLAGISATLPDPATPGTRKTVQDDRYKYLAAGDISSIKDHTDGQSQCYRYDGLHRLTEAYTATDDCAADPTNVGATGKHPYWDSFAFDNAGRRTADTHRTGAGTTSRTYTYPAAGQPRPHAMASVAVTANGSSRTDTFGYDLDGTMKTRTVAGVKSDYTINPEGRFDGALVAAAGGQEQTKHVYDADGQLLIRSDPGGKTLRLGGEEFKATGNAVSGTRYYSNDGSVVAVRTKDGFAWLAADHQASANLTVDPISGDVQRRWYTPYGADRAAVTDWPTDRGFLNAPANTSTKLLDVGAREYDPDTGTFIAPDPLVDVGNPTSFNPYAYAHHNPISLADPTGLAPSGGISFQWDGQDTENAIVAGAMVVGATVAIAACGTGWGCLLTAAVVGGTVGYAGYTAEPGHRVQAAAFALGAAALGGGVGAGARLLAVKAGVSASARGVQAVAGAAAGVTESAVTQYGSTGSVDWRQLVLDGVAGGALGAAVKVRGGCTPMHSFAPDTPVLMADGSTKPIEDIEIGDEVTATDPETGETEGRPVEQLHANHDTDLTDLTVTVKDTTPTDGTDDSATTVFNTTQHHPFWDETTDEWVYAADLIVGHELRTIDGDTVTVTAVRNYAGGEDMRDLTVTDVHTYYVIASNTPVLVHNVDLNHCGVPGPSEISFPRHSSRKTAAAVENPDGGHLFTLSGWGRASRAFTRVATATVGAFRSAFGLSQRGHGNDLGIFGRYFNSHAEAQAWVLKQDGPIIVNRDPCRGCQEFLTGAAMHGDRSIVVSSPSGTWAFHPTGDMEFVVRVPFAYPPGL